MRRRTFFGIVGAGVAISGAAMSGVAAMPAAARAQARSRSPNLDFLFAPLVGRPLPGGFRVASVTDVERGAITVTLARADGAQAIVQAFRRSPASSGLATTRLLDLRWMNGADGDRVTPEAAGVAVMQLAARVRRIEGALARGPLAPEHRAALRALYTHERRTALHGGFAAGSETA